MSRTYRRKDQKKWWLWFITEQEFEEAKAASLLPNQELECHQWRHGVMFKKQKFVKPWMTYRQYKKAMETLGHSENGYGDRYYKSAPKWYVNLFLNRPFRQKHKREIQKTLALAGEYDVVLSPLKRSASYYW